MIPGIDGPIHGAPAVANSGFLPASGPALLRMTLPSADEALKGAAYASLNANGGLGAGGSFAQQQPRFIFRPRTGKINWRLLHSLDLDRVIREGDVETIQAHMDNITYAKFSKDDLDMTSDECMIKVVQLAQLCMEFLCSMCGSSQQLLQGLVEKVRVQTAQLKAAEKRSHQGSRQRDSKSRRRSTSRDVEVKKPVVSNGPSRKCQFCPKRFQTEQYLYEHILRRHEKEFASMSHPQRFAAEPITMVPREPIVFQPQVEPTPQSQTQPRPVANPEVTQVLHTTLGLKDQLEGVQRDFSSAIEAMRHEVGGVVQNMARVAKDVVKLQNVPPPASPAAVAPVAHAGIDEAALEKRNAELENMVVNNHRMLLKKIEEVAAAAPAAAVVASVPSGPSKADLEEAAQMAARAATEGMKKQMDELQKMREEMSKQFASSTAQLSDTAAKAVAKAAEEAAARAASAAKNAAAAAATQRVPPTATVREDSQPAAVPDGTVKRLASQDPVAVPERRKSKEKKEAVPQPAAPPAAAPPSAPPAGEPEVRKEPKEPTLKEQMGPGGLTKEEAGRLREQLLASKKVPEKDVEEMCSHIIDGPSKQNDVENSFHEMWEEGLSELRTQDEQIRFMLAMTQERTRPRKPTDGKDCSFEDQWASHLDEEDAALGLQTVDDPNEIKKAAALAAAKAKAEAAKRSKKTSCFGRGKSKDKAATGDDDKKESKAEKVAPPDVRATELAEKAFAGGFADFLHRCRHGATHETLAIEGQAIITAPRAKSAPSVQRHAKDAEPSAKSSDVCACGTKFLADSKFCPKCGAKRPDAPHGVKTTSMPSAPTVPAASPNSSVSEGSPSFSGVAAGRDVSHQGPGSSHVRGDADSNVAGVGRAGIAEDKLDTRADVSRLQDSSVDDSDAWPSGAGGGGDSAIRGPGRRVDVGDAASGALFSGAPTATSGAVAATSGVPPPSGALFSTAVVGIGGASASGGGFADQRGPIANNALSPGLSEQKQDWGISGVSDVSSDSMEAPNTKRPPGRGGGGDVVTAFGEDTVESIEFSPAHQQAAPRMMERLQSNSGLSAISAEPRGPTGGFFGPGPGMQRRPGAAFGSVENQAGANAVMSMTPISASSFDGDDKAPVRALKKDESTISLESA